MIDVRQLRYFAKVIEVGSFTRAAAELHVSQPALSLQVRQLEKELGIELFVRGARGTVPTAGGAFLHKRSIEILSAVEKIRPEMEQFKTPGKKRLSVGLPPSIGRQLGGQILLDAHRCMPNVMLRLIEAFSPPLRDAASRGEIDIGFMFDVEKTSSLDMTPLLLEHFALIMRNDSSQTGEPSIPLRDVLARKLVIQRDHTMVLQALRDAADEHSTPVEVVLETQSVEAISDIVERGLAAAILPYGIMADSVRSGRVVAKRIVKPDLTRTLYFVQPKQRGTGRSKAEITKFVDAIRTALIKSLGDFCQPL